MKKFEFLPHTADVKIRVYGKNLKEIINNSLLALKNFLKPKLTKTKIEKEIKVESNNEVNLLIDFLSEVLTETYTEKAIFVEFIPRINTDQTRINTDQTRINTDQTRINTDNNIRVNPRGNPRVSASYSLSGKIIGYRFVSLSKEIKAITYHQANLQKINNQYIFDFIIDI
jgi:SHS2 domain-containing protein